MSTRGYLLDTNVVSELAKPNPDEALARWIRPLAARELFLSAVTIGELVRGIARMPPSHRRDRLHDWFSVDLEARFFGRILPYDEAAAKIWGEMMGQGDRSGRPRSVMDTQIVSIAIQHHLTVATRNVADFRSAGVSFVDPWRAA